MDTLPPDIIWNLAITTHYDTLLNLCQVNKSYTTLCNDPELWRQKAVHDFIDTLYDSPLIELDVLDSIFPLDLGPNRLNAPIS